MERKEVLIQMDNLFRDILDNDEIELTEDTTADDIDEWDSLTQIQLIVAIEKEFSVKFKSSEIIKWQKVKDMVDTILKMNK